MIKKLRNIHFFNLRGVSNRYSMTTNKNRSDFKNIVLRTNYEIGYDEIELINYQNSYLNKSIGLKAVATVKFGPGDTLYSQPKTFIDKYQKITNIEIINLKFIVSNISFILLHLFKSIATKGQNNITYYWWSLLT